MTVGQSTAHAHSILNVMRATDYTAFVPWLRLHTGDPGSAGTANASAETTRKQLSFAAPSAGSSVATAASWTGWSAGAETISYFSIWDASTGGNFKQSGQFSVAKGVTNSDTFNATITATQGPLAA